MKETRGTQGGENRRVVFLPKDDPDAAWIELQRVFANDAEPVGPEGTGPTEASPDHDPSSS